MSRQDNSWIIVTGLSGSGKSVALATLEDLDFYCIDNLPIGLVETTLAHLHGQNRHGVPRIALGIDIRSGEEEISRLPEVVAAARKMNPNCRVFFLNAADATLLRRFSETRRRHPLDIKSMGLSQAIARERKLMAPLLEMADVKFDTSDLSIHQLRREICDTLGMGEQPLVLLLESFAFKQGVPADLDIAFDARCLPNPHWEPDLRPLSGREPEVQEYLAAQPDVNAFVEDICTWLETWLPRYQIQNRSSLTIGIGCTGGRHRSVYVAEQVADHFRSRHDQVLTYHRELI
ncbi:MAG: RNase adapter RapZ [Xanthomonadales bacterium]|nr:RNase adapter RapZ [Xanthomonadales bacterium]